MLLEFDRSLSNHSSTDPSIHLYIRLTKTKLGSIQDCRDAEAYRSCQRAKDGVHRVSTRAGAFEGQQFWVQRQIFMES